MASFFKRSFVIFTVAFSFSLVGLFSAADSETSKYRLNAMVSTLDDQSIVFSQLTGHRLLYLSTYSTTSPGGGNPHDPYPLTLNLSGTSYIYNVTGAHLEIGSASPFDKLISPPESHYSVEPPFEISFQVDDSNSPFMDGWHLVGVTEPSSGSPARLVMPTRIKFIIHDPSSVGTSSAVSDLLPNSSPLENVLERLSSNILIFIGDASNVLLILLTCAALATGAIMLVWVLSKRYSAQLHQACALAGGVFGYIHSHPGTTASHGHQSWNSFHVTRLDLKSPIHVSNVPSIMNHLSREVRFYSALYYWKFGGFVTHVRQLLASFFSDAEEPTGFRQVTERIERRLELTRRPIPGLAELDALGAFLRGARIRNGLNRHELARRLQCEPEILLCIESGSALVSDLNTRLVRQFRQELQTCKERREFDTLLERFQCAQTRAIQDSEDSVRTNTFAAQVTLTAESCSQDASTEISNEVIIEHAVLEGTFQVSPDNGDELQIQSRVTLNQIPELVTILRGKPSKPKVLHFRHLTLFLSIIES